MERLTEEAVNIVRTKDIGSVVGRTGSVKMLSYTGGLVLHAGRCSALSRLAKLLAV